MGLAAVPYLVSAASAYAGAANQAHAVRKQDKQAALGIEQQAARRKEATSRVNQTVESIGQSSPDAARKQSYSQFMDALRGSASTPRVQGATSAAYKAGSKAADSKVGDYSSNLSDVFSRVDALGRTRQNEAVDMARAGSEVDTIQNLAKGDDFVNNLRIKGIRANPWVDLLSKFGMAAGGGMAAAGFGTGGAAGGAAALGGGKSAVDYSTMARSAFPVV